MNNADAATSTDYTMEDTMIDADAAYEAACFDACDDTDYDAVIEMPVVVTDLMKGDVIVRGHGYGEKPATVIRAGRFNYAAWSVLVTDGTGERLLTVATNFVFDVQR